MFQMPDSPQSIGKVLDSGFRLFAYSFKHVFFLVLIAAVAIALPNMIFGNTTDPQVMAQSVGPMLAMLLVGWLVFLVFYNAVFYRMNALADDRDAGAGEAIGAGLRKMLPVLGAGILFSLAVMVGSLLLLIPGVILMVSLILYVPLIVCDDEGVFSALRTSHNLVWGDWWRTTAVFLVPFVVYIVVYMAVAMIVGAVAGASAVTSGEVGDSVYTMINVAMVVISVIAYPFFAAIMLVQLNDLKLRKRGGDLEAQLAGD
jgi:hypothetical protein